MDLMELFTKINEVFDNLSFLSQQYSFRFITILINQWNDKKIEEYLSEISKLIAKFISNWTHNSSKAKQVSGGIKEMNYLSIIIEKISLNNQLIQQIAEGNKELVKSISDFIAVHHKDEQYEFFIETFLIFINKLSKFPSSIQNLIDAKIPERSLNYISQGKEFKIDEIDSIEDLIQKLSSIQNVMKVIKNCYERNIKESDKKAIQDMVKNHREMINISDQLLQKYSDHDDIAIIVVNIIICFNSINKQLKPAHVKTWIENFTNRLIKCPNSKEIDKRYKMWYMEKYVFILELLVTKNIDKIEKDITLKLTEITKLDKTYFNRTTWYKIVKILAHLRYLSILFNDKEIFRNIFTFILSA